MKIIALIISIFTISFTSTLNLENTQSLEHNIDTKGKKSFAGFLSHFDKVDIPDNIDHSKIQEYKAKFLIDGNKLTSSYHNSKADVKNYIPEAMGSKFSRVGPPIVLPLERFYTDENTIAVTYLVRYPFEQTGFSVKLSLFDLRGNNKLSNLKPKSKLKRGKSIAIASFGLENTVLCTFTDIGTVSITSFKNNWEKDIHEFGIDGNRISNYDKHKSEVYSINSNGAIDIGKVKPSYVGLK